MTEVPTYFSSNNYFQKLEYLLQVSASYTASKIGEWRGLGAKTLSTFQPRQNPKVLIPSLREQDSSVSQDTHDLRIQACSDPSVHASPISPLCPDYTQLNTADSEQNEQMSQGWECPKQFTGACSPLHCVSFGCSFPQWSFLFCNTLRGTERTVS